MKRLILAAFLLAMPAFGQSYGRLNFQLQTAQGQAVSGATIYVYSESACGSAAGAQAQLYSSATGGPIGQPLYTNGLGQQSAYVVPGCVTVVYNSPYTGQLTYPDQLVAVPSSAVSVNGIYAPAYNFNDTTPAADAGYQLGTFKVSSSNVSVEVPASSVTASPQYEVPYYSGSGTASALTGSANLTLNASDLLTLSGGVSLSGTDGGGNFLQNGLSTLSSSTSGITDYTLIGNGGIGASLGNYTGFTYQTTSTFSSGATSITVTSAGTPIQGQGVVGYNAVSGPGIQAGTTVTSFSGTTVNLSKATNANETGATLTFSPGPTSGSVVIGYGAGANLVASNDLVAIGTDALADCTTSGEAIEDNNSVVIGWNAASHDTCNHINSSGTYPYMFEDVVIGHTAYGYGQSAQSSVYIGNHIEAPTLGFNSVWLGGSITQGWGSGGANSFIEDHYDVFIGGGMFGTAPASSTTFTARSDVYISPMGAGCLYNTNYNTVIGAYVGYDTAGGTCPNVFTGTNNLVLFSGIGGNSTYTPGPPLQNWTSGGGNVILGAASYSAGTSASTGNALTTGNGNTLAGGGAGSLITTGSFNTLYGDGAGQAWGSSGLTAYGYEAFLLANLTSGTSTGAAFGYQACSSITSAAGNSCFGAYTGLNETSANNLYVGSKTGDRSAATSGYNVALGSDLEFYDTSGGGSEVYDTFVGSDSNCLGCTYGISIGYSAQIGAVAHATQIDVGTNSTANSMQFQSTPIVTTKALTATQITGCGTVTSPVGNGLVGTFAAGATSCTPVLTTGVTAPNGFVCEIHDWTTPADLLTQASTTSTTATFAAATVASGDTIAFSCKPF